MTREELIEKYLKFFEKNGHKIINGSSVIPNNDPTVLFTTAGMHPLVPYLLGSQHPEGKRLTDVQRCIRTSDIDEVGDDSHLTFFEMLGNWSLGDYFKEKSIFLSYTFLTDKEYLNLDPNKLYFTCFKGNETTPKDTESYSYWKNLGVDDSHIFYLTDNFWILGSGIGPCGPDSEIFFDTGKEKCSKECVPGCDCQKYLEIWNNVFMQYEKKEDGTYKNLTQQNVDTGMGVERTITVLNNKKSVYDNPIFEKVIELLEQNSDIKYKDNLKSYRIVMDHIRTSVMILGDINPTFPSNVGAGYVLRRLIRRALRHLKVLGLNSSIMLDIASIYINIYKDTYKELENNKDIIINELKKEEEKFSKTLNDGERHFKTLVKHINNKTISSTDAFKLFDTFGFPLEFTCELASEIGYSVDTKGFYEKFKEHQVKSRTIDAGSFKGGLADLSYTSVKYHTLAHILLSSLKEMFGEDVVQKGCNITTDRIRFDFNCDHKLTEEEKEQLTNRVNNIINEDIKVTLEEMSLEEAKKCGAHGTFENKYGNIVKVYTIGNISKEICGGPHVKSTKELGTFKIIKEESSSSGIRRIKGVLE
ncbi:MAG: alanine--tRNA ligase [Bacilli bacterium]